MSTHYPEIRIKDGWLLRANASQYLHKLWGKGGPLADDDWMEKRVREYTDAWKPYEKKILRGLHEVLGLEYRQNIIDVYIAPWFNAFSDPLVIGVMREPDEFIDILTHELIHRLLTDNTTLPYDTWLLSRWEKLFGKGHSIVCLIHIPVHAVHKAIYLDILKAPERLKRDITGNQKSQSIDHVKAWEYVERHDYRAIIKKLVTDYKRG